MLLVFVQLIIMLNICFQLLPGRSQPYFPQTDQRQSEQGRLCVPPLLSQYSLTSLAQIRHQPLSGATLSLCLRMRMSTSISA